MRANNLVGEYFSLWNHYDAEGIADLLIGNGCYFDKPKNLSYEGQGFVKHLQEVFDSMPLRYELVGEVLVGNSSIAFQYETYYAKENLVRSRGAEFIILSDNKLSRIEDYYQVFNPMPSESAAKYKKSSLDAATANHYKQQLNYIMAMEKPYQDADLKLADLAHRLGLSINHLSQLINSECAMSYRDYINSFRIDEAKIRLSNPNDLSSILDIGLEVGFNSNSTFYAAFKKHCQQTPLHYRQSILGHA